MQILPKAAAGPEALREQAKDAVQSVRLVEDPFDEVEDRLGLLRVALVLCRSAAERANDRLISDSDLIATSSSAPAVIEARDQLLCLSHCPLRRLLTTFYHHKEAADPLH